MNVRSHYVATGYVYDQGAARFLLVQHRKLGKWLAPGGHLEAGEEPHLGALREVEEEIGCRGRILDMPSTPRVATPTVPQLPTPFCVLAETIPASPREEEHIHIDFIYVVEIEAEAAFQMSEAEIERLQWFTLAEIEQLDTFENVRQVCRAISMALPLPGPFISSGRSAPEIETA
jgi:8-oxo-dGTP pyrophosphatase MutT (NUDIX family)